MGYCEYGSIALIASQCFLSANKLYDLTTLPVGMLNSKAGVSPL
jgi:hypothetical protein